VDQGFVVGPPPRALVVHRAYAPARAVLGHAPGRASARRPHACARPAGHAAPSALGYPRLVLVAWSSQGRRKISRNAVLCSLCPHQSGVAGAERRWASTQRSSSPFNPCRARSISFVSSTPTSPLRHLVLRSRAPARYAAGIEPHQGRMPPLPSPAILRTISTPSEPKNRTLGEPLSIPTTSPVHPGDELAGFWISPSLAAARDYIARSEVFLGAGTQNPGTCS
jgi:hypothetical protein